MLGGCGLAILVPSWLINHWYTTYIQLHLHAFHSFIATIHAYSCSKHNEHSITILLIYYKECSIEHGDQARTKCSTQFKEMRDCMAKWVLSYSSHPSLLALLPAILSSPSHIYNRGRRNVNEGVEHLHHLLTVEGNRSCIIL